MHLAEVEGGNVLEFWIRGINWTMPMRPTMLCCVPMDEPTNYVGIMSRANIETILVAMSGGNKHYKTEPWQYQNRVKTQDNIRTLHQKTWKYNPQRLGSVLGFTRRGSESRVRLAGQSWCSSAERRRQGRVFLRKKHRGRRWVITASLSSNLEFQVGCY